MSKITPFLWFDTEGEEAAKFYTSVFPNSNIVDVAHYGEAGSQRVMRAMLSMGKIEIDALERAAAQA